MSRDTPAEAVAGERPAALPAGLLSTQSRIGNALAVTLMSVVGLGGLTWYYAHALTRHDEAKESAQAAASRRAQGDLPLPKLGRIQAPTLAAGPLPSPAGGAPPDLPQDLPPLGARTLLEIAPGSAGGTAFGGQGVAPGGPPPKTPEQLALERQLSGTVFAAAGGLGAALAAVGAGAGADPAGAAGMAGMAGMAGAGGASAGAEPAGSPGPGALGALLQARATPAVRARVLPAQRLLLPKGAFIDCTLETAIDSTLPGMTTCIMATDTFGVDGKVVLMERGTKLIGETRGEVQQGSARIFVLWMEARTPTGVIVPLDSPGADELGRSGLAGEVNRHFWQRFGAAMLVSIIDGAVQGAVQSARGGGGALVVNPSSSQDVLTAILKNTINIAPTVVKRNGDRIQVLVARDLDFRSVYELHSVAARP